MILTCLTILAVALIFVKYFAELWLDALNAKCVRASADAVPEVYKGMIEDDEYFKSVRYTLDKIRFSIYEGGYGAAVMSLILLFGVLPFLFCNFIDVFGTSVWAQSLSLILVLTIIGLPSLPFEWYSQFVIEQRYGFNKSTIKLWMTDKIKEFIIGLVIGIPLLSLILWLFGVFANTWWIWAFGAMALFQVLMLVLYPRLILPLFNKLSPLEGGELKDGLLAMSDRAGFKANAIFVIDGSKRSSHSNAFFTGFGKFRRIVLYDTLLTQLSAAELEAVLAHEIGHYKLGHIPKMIAGSFAMMFCGFAAIAWLARSPWFYEAFGFSANSGMAPALLLFSLLVPLFTFWLSPIFNAVSRRYEYQADAFAKQVCGGSSDLIASLRKLHTKNLGNLTPHKIYSAFHYSHPTLLERENALKGN